MKVRFLFLAAILAVGLYGSSCSHFTVAPPSVISTQASFDGDIANSGIISVDASGFLVTQHFIDRHGLTAGTKRLLGLLSSNPNGIVAEGPNYRITAEVMTQVIAADQKRKNAQH